MNLISMRYFMLNFYGQGREVTYYSSDNGGSVKKLKATTADRVEGSLMFDSPEVIGSNGFFINQPGGLSHMLCGKMVRITTKHFNLLLEYMKENCGNISPRAKSVFESGNLHAIQDLIRESHGKKGMNL